MHHASELYTAALATFGKLGVCSPSKLPFLHHRGNISPLPEKTWQQTDSKSHQWSSHLLQLSPSSLHLLTMVVEVEQQLE